MSDILTILQDAERSNMAGDKNAAIEKYSILTSILPLVASALFNRGVCYHHTGRYDDARYDILKSAQIDNKYFALARNQGLGQYVEDLSGRVLNLSNTTATITAGDAGQNRASFWADDMNINSMSDFYRSTVKEIISAIPTGNILIDRSSVIMTFGSCFAINMGRALVSRGFNVENTLIPEDVNSSYANKYLFEWLANGEVNKFTQYFEVLYGENVRVRLRETIRTTDLVIMTIGVAPCLFNLRHGEFAFTSRRNDKARFDYLEGPYRLRTTSVQENFENISFIFQILKAFNKDIKVVLSVSPVPLTGTNEMSSVVIADCISKSTVRLAAHEIIKQYPQVIYWPSFEIVRWLSGHSNFRVFGKDDNHSRHVNNDIVDMIIDLFIDKYARN